MLTIYNKARSLFTNKLFILLITQYLTLNFDKAYQIPIITFPNIKNRKIKFKILSSNRVHPCPFNSV